VSLLPPEPRSSTKSQRLHARARGRVQGVGFRAATLREGRGLGLRGWVRNLPDGGVEVVAEGPRATLDALVAFLRRGPRGAHVSHVDTIFEPVFETLGPESPPSFEIR
jgi:acylphosphatase